mmetsp:Transcript_18732/g.30730  ORF Transcript_18732/g.30730 Transcript_18732/m.30730 type:complete len:95 (-) Transcript_18732:8-292(-)
MALERDLSTLLSLSSSLSSIFLALTEAVWADLFPPAPNFFSCWLIESGKRRGRDNDQKWYIEKARATVGWTQSIIYLLLRICTRMSKKSKEEQN